ncbi:hypothetical protein [Actibacterium sp. 188UL27-1]|uniref:hypothetical protein n=1 Tax=Actibacterium sp. 188UL27-1 TaxID=2786961 RepID=UPI00195DD11B|nr:hypothetical protein [Actibacterium sp. 188UL27-1]MBM7070327.1 hypothetical protein [Actibacterium sp. 188UL27-1]
MRWHHARRRVGEGQFRFILPMSGRFLAFITGGTPISDRMSGYFSRINGVTGDMWLSDVSTNGTV